MGTEAAEVRSLDPEISELTERIHVLMGQAQVLSRDLAGAADELTQFLAERHTRRNRRRDDPPVEGKRHG